MSRAPSITVNGETRPFEKRSVRALVAAMGIAPERRGIAVAVNGQVVPRDGWDATVPGPGDAVEIVQPLAGG